MFNHEAEAYLCTFTINPHIYIQEKEGRNKRKERKEKKRKRWKGLGFWAGGDWDEKDDGNFCPFKIKFCFFFFKKRWAYLTFLLHTICIKTESTETINF